MLAPIPKLETLIELNSRQKNGEKVVFTNGCFDILHIGHLSILSDAKALGNILVVGLNSDDSIKRLKGDERPIIPESERAIILLSLKPVDYVIIFNEDTPSDLIHEIRPDVLAKGGDWSLESNSRRRLRSILRRRRKISTIYRRAFEFKIN